MIETWSVASGLWKSLILHIKEQPGVIEFEELIQPGKPNPAQRKTPIWLLQKIPIEGGKMQVGVCVEIFTCNINENRNKNQAWCHSLHFFSFSSARCDEQLNILRGKNIQHMSRCFLDFRNMRIKRPLMLIYAWVSVSLWVVVVSLILKISAHYWYW